MLKFIDLITKFKTDKMKWTKNQNLLSSIIATDGCLQRRVRRVWGLLERIVACTEGLRPFQSPLGPTIILGQPPCLCAAGLSPPLTSFIYSKTRHSLPALTAALVPHFGCFEVSWIHRPIFNPFVESTGRREAWGQAADEEPGPPWVTRNVIAS